MQSPNEQIPRDLEAQKAFYLAELKAKEQALALARNKILLLEEQLRNMQRKQFGSSSEKWEGQTLLFNEAEASATDKEPISSVVKGHDRKRPHRKPLPPELPRVEKTYDIGDHERICACGCALERIGEEVSEQLDIIPAKVQVIRHIRYKYACKACKSCMKTAKADPQPLPKSNASPGLLASIATSKFIDHLPLYRQEDILRRLGVDMARSTMARWMIELAGVIRPLYNLMQDDLMSSPVLHMDETPIQVLKGTGKAATSKSFMWVRCRYGPEGTIILFSFDTSRGLACARDLLLHYAGRLITDGYEVYDSISRSQAGIIHCGCWDHVRRKFSDALKAAGDDAHTSLAAAGLSYIQALYAVEKRVKEATDDERLKARQLYSRSIMDHLQGWLGRVLDCVPPKSLTGKALSYLKSEWPKLVKFVDDGAIPISNALAENAIRPFAIGRKNWLFSATTGGADASAVIYSLLQTAKANGHDPYRYMRRVLEILPAMKTADEIATLLPYGPEMTPPILSQAPYAYA
jgi:transposase